MTFNILICFAAALICGVQAAFVFFEGKAFFCKRCFRLGDVGLCRGEYIERAELGASSQTEVKEWHGIWVMLTAFIAPSWAAFRSSVSEGKTKGNNQKMAMVYIASSVIR